jgi:hypothetical protein
VECRAQSSQQTARPLRAYKRDYGCSVIDVDGKSMS